MEQPMAATTLAPVSDLVGHLRWRIGPPGEDDLLSTSLTPDRLVEVVASTAAGRGSDDPQVLGSLWWQAYAYRLAGTTLAGWVVAGGAPDPSAPGAGVGVARSRPSSLLVDPGAVWLEDAGQLVAATFTNLEAVGSALKDGHRLGAQLLWGNVAAGISSAVGACVTAPDAPHLADRVDALLTVLPGDVTSLGEWTVDPFTFRRKTCCLWWKTTAADGALCEDCSLR
jgi:hypothetical protein